jgi:dihydroorotate dehydrogenase (fumarate)
MGLKLENPLIVSSSSLTGTVDGVIKCAEAGAGAVVLKSLFEEQIRHDLSGTENSDDMTIHPEAVSYISKMGMHLGPEEYIKLIRESKKKVSIPVIASINCITDSWWVNYARQLEDSGADALELNISAMPRNLDTDCKDIDDAVVRLAGEVNRHVKLPLAVKIGPYFSSLSNLALRLQQTGIAALVLFNRFYQLDIDTKNEKLKPGYQYSSPKELHLPLRWISILNEKIDCDFAASTGVHSAEDAVKMILAGAKAVQLCSLLYLKGIDELGAVKTGLSQWMKEHKYASIADFHGRLCQTRSDEPEAYERLQYIKALTGIT